MAITRLNISANERGGRNSNVRVNWTGDGRTTYIAWRITLRRPESRGLVHTYTHTGINSSGSFSLTDVNGIRITPGSSVTIQARPREITSPNYWPNSASTNIPYENARNVKSTINGREATVSWDDPLNTYGPFTHYNIVYGTAITSSGFITTGFTRITGTTATTATFNLPDYGTNYFVQVERVYATRSNPGRRWYGPVIEVVTGTAPPENLTVTASQTEGRRIDTGWDASTGATHYDLQYSEDPNFIVDVTTLPGILQTRRSILGFNPGVRVYFRVRAANESGSSAWSASQSVVASQGPVLIPTKPQTINAVPSTGIRGRVEVLWSPSMHVTRYDIQRSTSPDFTSPSTFSSLTTAYVFDGLGVSTLYYFRVRGVNNNGEGGWSDTASAIAPPSPTQKPDKPVNLSAVASNTVEGQVDLTWAASQRAARYKLDTSTDSTFQSGVSTTTEHGTKASVTGLALDTTVYFRLAASNSVGDSDYSDEVSATPMAVTAPPAPNTPDNLRAVGSTQFAGLVSLVWNPSINARSYIIQRSTDVNFVDPAGITTIRDITDTSVNITGLSAGTRWYFRVAAVNATGTSIYSQSVGADTMPFPVAPVQVFVFPSPSFEGRAIMSWNGDDTNAFTYEVRYSKDQTFNTGVTTVVDITTDSRTIDGLETGSTWYFQVRSRNPVSASAWTPAVNTGIVAIVPPVVTVPPGEVEQPFIPEAPLYAPDDSQEETLYFHWLFSVEGTRGLEEDPLSPARHWWSGDEDIVLDSILYEGTMSQHPEGALARISTVEESTGDPDVRLKVEVYVDSGTARALLSRDIGSPVATLEWLVSRDNKNWTKLQRRFVGRLSNIQYESGVLTAEVESQSGDVDHIQIRYWTHESRIPWYPSDTSFLHLKRLEEQGSILKWPFL